VAGLGCIGVLVLLGLLWYSGSGVLCVTGLVNGLWEYGETDSKAVSGVSGSVFKGRRRSLGDRSLQEMVGLQGLVADSW